MQIYVYCLSLVVHDGNRLSGTRAAEVCGDKESVIARVRDERGARLCVVEVHGFGLWIHNPGFEL